MLEGKDRIDHYVSQFEALRGELSGGPEWLATRRRQASEAFAGRGFPTRRDEAWRFTSVEALARVPFLPMQATTNGVDAASVQEMTFGERAAARLVFVNGARREELSTTDGLPEGVRVRALSEILASDPGALEAHLGNYARVEDHPFVALNTALWRDGALIEVADGVVVEDPIHLVFVVQGAGEAAVAQIRNLVVAGHGAQVRIVETYGGADGERYWTNSVTEVVGAPGSVVEHLKIQRESSTAFHLATIQARLDRDANFTAHSVSLGGGLVRNDVNAVLAGRGAGCTLNGLYVLDGSRHEDNHTLIDHAEPHGTSRELYKGILDDQSSAVFNGGVLVRQDAQKTDARQTNNNLLLSDEALVDTKPELQIYADDVKCAHGATVGQLQADWLFYLQSRGLAKEAARSLMIYAFAAEVLDRIRMEALQLGLKAAVARRLPNLELAREDL